jgi:glycine cleavage system transcriptional repressor
MTNTVVITGCGRDRVGIVAELTSILFDAGCNLLDSSMTLLRGEFALILMATLPDSMSVEALETQLSQLQEKLKLQLSVRKLADDELMEQDADQFQFIVSVYGADRPGIVSGITRAIAELDLNISDVQTKKVTQGSREIFVMMLELSSKKDVRAEFIKSKLEEKSKSLSVDLTVRELEVMEL